MTVNHIQERILSVICIWEVIWLVVSLYIGCVCVWESRGWGVLTVALSGEGGGVVTFTQHTWWQWSKWGHDASRHNPFCPTYTLLHVCRYTHAHIQVPIYTCTQLNNTWQWEYCSAVGKKYTWTHSYTHFPQNSGQADIDDYLPTHDVVSWADDNRYCVFQSSFWESDKVCLDLFSREWLVAVRLLTVKRLTQPVCVTTRGVCVYVYGRLYQGEKKRFTFTWISVSEQQTSQWAIN